MSKHTERLFEDALKLTDSDRANLAARLLESLDSESDEGLDEAWSTEIGKRIEELNAGKVTPVPWAEARRVIAGDEDVTGGG